MQVPYAGSEYAIKAERERQATSTLTENGLRELEPLQILTENKCESTPTIREYHITQQGDDDLVPGGFLHYILMDRVPGVELSQDVFWSLDREERDDIREAFQTAWLQCLEAGVRASMGHLFWDRESSKMWFPSSGIVRSPAYVG
ncbi:hypothetical protein BJX70DRAFT_361414 [Aspergillus crustosus]